MLTEEISYDKKWSKGSKLYCLSLYLYPSIQYIFFLHVSFSELLNAISCYIAVYAYINTLL